MSSVDFSGLFLALFVYYAVVFALGFAVTFCFVYLTVKKVLPAVGLFNTFSRLAVFGISLAIALPGGFMLKEYQQHRNAMYTERGEKEFLRKKEAFARRQMSEYRVVSLEPVERAPRAFKLTFTVPEAGLYDLHAYADLPPKERRRVSPLVPAVNTTGASEDGEGELRREWGKNYEPYGDAYNASGIHGGALLSENRYDMRLDAGRNSVYFRIPESLPDRSLDGLDFYVHIGPDLQGEKEVLYNTTEGFVVTNPGAPVLYEGATYHSPNFENGCPEEGSVRYAHSNCAAIEILDFELPRS